MLDQLKKLFGSEPQTADEKPGAFAPDDARVAVAALLVHMIRIDGEVTEDEQRVIRSALDRQYGLSGDMLEEVLAEAKRRDDEAIDLYGFTSTLKYKLSEEERAEVIELLWHAVFADGVVNELEDNMVWRTAELLGVSSRDRMILRKKVAGATEAG
ncbi:MAG: TerB family tellurite resistance protein [Devosiaceae bacterium]|nr:TerB family tellurite resistance protein [Devosiaceae bacterium MH13]